MNTPDVSPLLPNPPQQALLFGEVQAVTPHGFIVRQHNAGTLLAERAFSCPYNPAIGDWVSMIQAPDNHIFILAILRRTSDQVATLSNDHGLRIETNQAVSIHSESLELVNASTRITALDTRLQGQRLDIHTGQASFNASKATTVVGKMLSRFQDSVRIIERLEQIKANDLIQNVRNLFMQRSRQADISAEKDVKINGERIHMG